VLIAYSLTDAESETCSITVHYSLDGGDNWNVATAGSGGDGTTGLSSSPSGSSHTFVWASGSDIVNVNNYHIPLALEAAFFCHTRGIPFVLTSHYHGRGHTAQRNLLFQLYGLVAKEMMAWSERVICVSEYERSLVVRDFPFVKDKITIATGCFSWVG